MEALQKAQTHIAIFTTPGMGHVIPLIELAQKLIQLHGFAITFIIPDDGSPNKQQKAFLEAFPAINSIFLPPAICDDLPEDANIGLRIMFSVIRSIPSLCKVLSNLKESCRLSAFVVDFFGSFSFDAVKELGISIYLFLPFSAMASTFALHLPELDKSCTCEYRDLPEPVKFPGCIPIHGSDLVDTVQDRKTETYKLCVEMCKKFTLAEGILVDSFPELEPNTFTALEQEGSSTAIPVYPIGPLIRPSLTETTSDDKAECLKWLDEQPAGSVLFVSFGSGGALSTEQLKELSVGLEMSKQRFLLVARRPFDKFKNAATEDKTDSFEYFPSGFIERIKGTGFVLSDWAPQIDVLCHRAVGGFLTHCGWNSTLESISNGMPLIAWPLYAEQRMNAVLLSEDLKVALSVRENENGVVDSEQIAGLVRTLMEGEEGEKLRNRMSNLKDAVGRALSQDGSYTKSLTILAEKWKTRIAP